MPTRPRDTRPSVKPARTPADSFRMGIRARSWGLVVGLGLAALASPSAAEIYRWTDRDGRVHFTQDLSKVPASQRPDSERAAKAPARSGYNRISGPGSSAPAAASPASVAVVRSAQRGPIQLPYETRGGAMFVMVRLNDLVTAPFIVDTGASDVSIPAAVAAKAGIRVGPDTPHMTYQTANGLVRSPIVTLDAVQVGEARVEGVRGSISQSMKVGLLGGTFFNNFTMQIDPAANLITLLRNDRIRSGLSESEWRGRFRAIQSKLRTLELYIENNHFTREARRRELDERLAVLRSRLDALDEEADRADVPQAWRDG